uniref:Peptidase metallopeptidase domain-containing protein n=1 Tax=Periophthalmus magnuspinnatus TaxID=409849 RepID=A0A3B4ATL4_9GOBI
MELVWSWILAWGSLFVGLSWTLPVQQQDDGLRPEDVQLAENYLTRFYKLSPEAQRGPKHERNPRTTSETADHRIREMQHFFGLSETGLLDHQTLDTMKEARCGVPDVDNFNFYPNKPRWKNNTITYMIARYTPDMRKDDVDKSFRLAFKMWSDASPLRFVQVERGKADIILTFARGFHGDFFPFDGPKGVLAHAFQPGSGIGGDIHFDEDETWTTGSHGYSLFAVAAHELGHSLGLTHSQDPSAIMYPNYRRRSNKQYSLSKDDILGIQTLYGKPTERADMAPRKLWISLWAAAAPLSHIAVTHLYVCVFTGHKYWVVQQLKTKSHAASISDFGFSSSVKHIDAVVHVSEYGKTIFFTGDLYYRYDERKRKMDSGFPRHIHIDWPGIPSKVNAAFKLQGSIFIISGTKSYQYDYRKNKVVKIISANSWLGC